MERSNNKLRRVFGVLTCVRFLINISFDVYVMFYGYIETLLNSMVSGKKNSGTPLLPPWQSVRVRVWLGLSLGSGFFFFRGDFFLEPNSILICIFFLQIFTLKMLEISSCFSLLRFIKEISASVLVQVLNMKNRARCVRSL